MPLTDAKTARAIPRRAKFNDLPIFLPRMLRVDGDSVPDFDYETDLLSRINSRDYDPSGIAPKIPVNTQVEEFHKQRISLTECEDGELIKSEQIAVWRATVAFDPSYVARLISDLVPNPFFGRDIVG